jgi:hypothetical protein
LALGASRVSANIQVNRSNGVESKS